MRKCFKANKFSIEFFEWEDLKTIEEKRHTVAYFDLDDRLSVEAYRKAINNNSINDFDPKSIMFEIWEHHNLNTKTQKMLGDFKTLNQFSDIIGYSKYNGSKEENGNQFFMNCAAKYLKLHGFK